MSQDKGHSVQKPGKTWTKQDALFPLKAAPLLVPHVPYLQNGDGNAKLSVPCNKELTCGACGRRKHPRVAALKHQGENHRAAGPGKDPGSTGEVTWGSLRGGKCAPALSEKQRDLG